MCDDGAHQPQGGAERNAGPASFPTEGEISKAKSGSLNDVWHLLERCRSYLLTIANDRYPIALKGAEGPSDLVQDTIIKGARGFEFFRGNTPEELRGWLSRILKNTVLNLAESYERAKRNRKRSVSLEGELSDSGQLSPSASLRAREEQFMVEAAIGRLKDEYRQILHLRYSEGLSFGEIGALMDDRTADAARKLWLRALESLQSELKPDER